MEKPLDVELQFVQGAIQRSEQATYFCCWGGRQLSCPRILAPTITKIHHGSRVNRPTPFSHFSYYGARCSMATGIPFRRSTEQEYREDLDTRRLFVRVILERGLPVVLPEPPAFAV